MSPLQCDGSAVPVNGNVRVLEHRGERRFHWQTALLMESVRRKTFSNWTVPFVDPDKLAAAGFFHLRTQDHVQCVFCQGIVGFWEQGDEPMVEHRKHFPNCPFVTGVATGNVPLATPDTDAAQLFKFLDEYHYFRVANTRPQLTTTNYQTDAVRIPDSGHLAYPNLNTIESRIQTFTRWPKNVGVSPDALVEAGFFSTGLADWVQCFHCGSGLYGWREGDDPVADHARFFPFCPFIRMKTGEEFIKQKCVTDPAPVSLGRTLTLTSQEEDLLLHHPIAQRVVGMGLSPMSVKAALKHRLESRGTLCRTVTEALELVFDYDEERRKNRANQQLCHDGLQFHDQHIMESTSTSSVPMQMETNSHFCPATAIQDKHISNEALRHTRLLQEVKDLQQQVLKEESRLLCRLCKKDRVAVVFQPCSHLHFCANCARPQDTCTTCGSVVRGTLRPIIG